jgi:hypothetical protein
VVLTKHHRFERFSSLQLGEHPLKDRTERLGANRIKYRTHVRVAWDPFDPIDGFQIALGAFFIKGKERGRFEGKQGERRHERIRSGNLCLGQAMIRDGVEAILQ